MFNLYHLCDGNCQIRASYNEMQLIIGVFSGAKPYYHVECNAWRLKRLTTEQQKLKYQVPGLKIYN